MRSKTPTKLLTCKNNQTSIIHLNAITIDPTDPNLFVVGGTDEYARMYDIRRYLKLLNSIDNVVFPIPIFYFGNEHSAYLTDT